MSTAAFALCGLKTREPAPLQGAFNFAVTNTIAAFMILTGIAFLYAVTGALNMAQIGLLLLQFLSDHLVSVATSAASLTFTFAFPRQADSFTLDVPTPDMFVLESRHPTDATLVHPLNTVRKADSEVRRIVFSRTVRVMIGRDRGIVGLGSGDLSVKKVFSFSCDMRYERRVGEVDVDGSGRQVVEDRDGKIRVEGGHYVLARYDDWLVLTVLGQQVQIGLPPFTRANE